jgi:lysophospholipase L1-like esterase
MPGISGNSEFRLNSCGIRGYELSSKYKKRILVVGGSTAECLYLDQAETWPYLLQRKLDQELKRDDIWVGNAGIAGKNAEDHKKLLTYFPLKRLKIDLIVVLVGINDLNKRLCLGKDYIPSYLKKEEHLAFFKKSFIWRMARELQGKWHTSTDWKVQDDAGKIFDTWRANRRSARKIINTLPDLSPALKEYVINVNALIDIAKKNNVRIVFMTQPTLWRAGLSPELRDLLWVGGIGDYQVNAGCDYYSIEALAEGMKMYNDQLLSICRSRNVECIDLAARLPKDTSVFYDDCHFNEAGAAQVADVLSQYLLKKRIISNQ